MTHSRKHYAVNRKRLAAMRAAKERLRLALPPCAGRSPLRRACVLALLRAKGVGV
jgi:hypothetical protein